MGRKSATFRINEQLGEQTLQQGTESTRVTGKKRSLSVKEEVDRSDH